MAITTTKSAFRKGLADAAPFVLVIIPFASLFGILATEAGLNVFETLAFSVVVIAGAAQFTALQLMQEHAPTAIVLASALAAYLTVDQSYVCAMAQYEKQPDMTIPQRMAYFFGCVTPIVPLWYLFTLVGAMVGAQIPESWALDFALPITFLAMIAPMFRTPAHVVAALVASVAGLLTAGVPYSLGLIIAGLAGMMAGAQTELWLERRQPQHPEQDAV